MLRGSLGTMMMRLGRKYKTLNRVELSRAAVLHNVRLIQRQHPDFGVIPVLKSNAYGHGLREMATILNDADVPFLAVDGYFEAARIRRLSRHRILVLGYIAPENAQLLDVKRCSFVVQDEVMLAALGRLRKRVKVHLELNTGMNRLGLNEEELPGYLRLLKRYRNLELEGVMSHLADADNGQDDVLTRLQVERFDAAVSQILAEGFTPKYIHIAQTAGSTKAESRYANALRLGIGLYGISPLAQSDSKASKLTDLKPVLSLKSTIIKVIDLRPGDIVGYNATFKAAKPMRIGVLPLGYYEGLPRALSNLGVVTAGGHQLKIVGRVSMNHAMVTLDGTELRVGDEVTVFSADPAAPNSIARLSADHGLFIYGLATGIASSIRRIIV
jgi:alanine racemase